MASSLDLSHHHVPASAGDGGNPTYTMARALAAPKLDIAMPAAGDKDGQAPTSGSVGVAAGGGGGNFAGLKRVRSTTHLLRMFKPLLPLMHQLVRRLLHLLGM